MEAIFNWRRQWLTITVLGIRNLGRLALYISRPQAMINLYMVYLSWLLLPPLCQAFGLPQVVLICLSHMKIWYCKLKHSSSSCSWCSGTFRSGLLRLLICDRIAWKTLQIGIPILPVRMLVLSLWMGAVQALVAGLHAMSACGTKSPLVLTANFYQVYWRFRNILLPTSCENAIQIVSSLELDAFSILPATVCRKTLLSTTPQMTHELCV